MWVLDELVCVSVAGHDDDVAAVILRAFSERGQDVVGLEPLQLDHREVQGIYYFSHEAHLLAEDVWSGFAPRLVFGVAFVAKRRLRQVEGDRNSLGLVVPHQVDQHRRKPEDSVGHLSRCRCHVGRKGEEGPIGERVSVDEQ